jgi:hypothetical protein
MKNTVRAFAVDATSTDGQRVVVVQIEIDCPECGTLTYVIPGHHLRTIRDVAIDHLDRFPELNVGTTTKKDSVTIALDADRSKKAGWN